LIYDTDGANPYGRELAALLSSTFEVEVLAPVQTEWSPHDLLTRRILPSNSRAKKVLQIIRQLHGLAAVARAAVAGATVVVVMARGWYDELAFALMALARMRVVVIAHDPKPKRPLPPLRAFSRRLLWQRASALVSHSEALAAEAAVVRGRSTAVVPHLPFSEYSAWADEAAPSSELAPKRRLLVLGQMRSDKGLNRIPNILSHLQPTDRKRLSVVFAGRGDCSEIAASVAELTAVVCRTSESGLSDVEIASVLKESDILIAPYPTVSASGTVVLALSTGLRVVAYDTGALSEVVAPDGLVPLGDEREFANRIMAAIRCGCGGPALAMATWRKRSFDSWMQCLQGLKGGCEQVSHYAPTKVNVEPVRGVCSDSIARNRKVMND
jgi:glycosyltransferase involved in cell wall biosynthesis